MREICGYKISDEAMKGIEEHCKVPIDELTKEELEEILYNEKRSDDLNIDENNEYVWAYGEEWTICYIDKYEGEKFQTVDDLNVYVSHYPFSGCKYYEGEIGDSEFFFSCFLGEDPKEFIQNVSRLIWCDKENFLFEELKDRLLSEAEYEEED